MARMADGACSNIINICGYDGLAPSFQLLTKSDCRKVVVGKRSYKPMVGVGVGNGEAVPVLSAPSSAWTD